VHAHVKLMQAPSSRLASAVVAAKPTSAELTPRGEPVHPTGSRGDSALINNSAGLGTKIRSSLVRAASRPVKSLRLNDCRTELIQNKDAFSGVQRGPWECLAARTKTRIAATYDSLTDPQRGVLGATQLSVK
jgi:hypothetical protein